jgi:hypothetical protein
MSVLLVDRHHYDGAAKHAFSLPHMQLHSKRASQRDFMEATLPRRPMQ